MGERNARLRAARERLPSHRVPGERLCRAELADMINAWLWEHTGRQFELDDHLIGKWERGIVRYPIAPYRAALRAVLDVDTDAELGFARSTRPTATAVTDTTAGEWTLDAIAHDAVMVTESDLINRRDALRATAVVGGAALVGSPARWVEPLAADAVRTVPGLSARSGAFSTVEVDALEQLVVAFRHWRSAGAGLARSAVVGQLAEVADRLRSAPSGPLTDRVFLAGAELAKIAGSMAFAQRGTRTTATPGLRAMLATREAWAQAQLGDVRQFRNAADTAEDAHAETDLDSEPRWLRTFDTAELLGTIGARYRDLARHNARRSAGAVSYLGRALEMRDPRRARNRAFDLVSLGRAHLIGGEPDRAAAAVESALPHVDRRRPGRLHRKLREWHDEAAVFATVSVIAETRDRVRATIIAPGTATAQRRSR